MMKAIHYVNPDNGTYMTFILGDPDYTIRRNKNKMKAQSNYSPAKTETTPQEKEGEANQMQIGINAAIQQINDPPNQEISENEEFTNIIKEQAQKTNDFTWSTEQIY